MASRELRKLKRARRQRGTATVEAAIAVPFFVLVLSGIWFVRARQLAIQSTENQARSCAWQYSANNCTAVPKGCEGLLSPGTAPHGNTKVDDVIDDAKSKVLAGGDSKGVIETVATRLLAPAIDALFGNFVQAMATQMVSRPGILGSGQTTIAGQYHLACNLQPTTPEQVVDDAWKKIINF